MAISGASVGSSIYANPSFSTPGRTLSKSDSPSAPTSSTNAASSQSASAKVAHASGISNLNQTSALGSSARPNSSDTFPRSVGSVPPSANMAPQHKATNNTEEQASQEQTEANQKPAKQEQLKQEAKEKQDLQIIQKLSARDREVRAHEQAHMAVGGQYAGAASYQFERGPNGINYATSGEVSISTSEGATPEETLQKARIIRRAALAPAEPSPQDRRVAAQASQMEAEALKDIAEQKRTEAQEQDDVSSKETSSEVQDEEIESSSSGTPDQSDVQQQQQKRLNQQIAAASGLSNRGINLSTFA